MQIYQFQSVTYEQSVSTELNWGPKRRVREMAAHNSSRLSSTRRYDDLTDTCKHPTAERESMSPPDYIYNHDTCHTYIKQWSFHNTFY